jgi:hypothetical protein
LNKTDSRGLRLNLLGHCDRGIIARINCLPPDRVVEAKNHYGCGEVEQNNSADKAVVLLCPYSPRTSDGSEMHYDTPITNLSPRGSHSDCQSIIH